MGDLLQKFPFQRFFFKHISQQVYHCHVQNDQHLFVMHQVNQLEALHFKRNISAAGVAMRIIFTMLKIYLKSQATKFPSFLNAPILTLYLAIRWKNGKVF